MAIASGLTCVDYLATNFYAASSFQEPADLRYSPTAAFGDVLTSLLSQKQTPSRHGSELQNSFYQPPLLEFHNLSITDSFDFTTLNKNNTSDDKNTLCNDNSDFVTEYEKVKDILNIGKTSMTNEKVEDSSKSLPPFSVNDQVCPQRKTLKPEIKITEARTPAESTKNIVHFETVNPSDDEDELMTIFGEDSPARNTSFSSRYDVARTKSNSLPRFHKFTSNSNDFSDADDEDGFSESEVELCNIITTPSTPSSPINGGFRHNARKRRTSVDFLSQTVGFCGVMKRPCIDPEKMHRSIRKGGYLYHHRQSRRNLEKSLFVPIPSTR